MAEVLAHKTCTAKFTVPDGPRSEIEKAIAERLRGDNHAEMLFGRTILLALMLTLLLATRSSRYASGFDPQLARSWLVDLDRATMLNGGMI